ncbi:hypothetical protein QVD99_006902 [Batrachochytrium dendrobatidis]|nr:hypothetical protein O5D80_007864 [Batrachochytrium dendrobatidis]KAK5666125.1 hypothetical protein QVD99_006902 [Batrachochytrium dendrobatidis]
MSDSTTSTSNGNTKSPIPLSSPSDVTATPTISSFKNKGKMPVQSSPGPMEQDVRSTTSSTQVEAAETVDSFELEDDDEEGEHEYNSDLQDSNSSALSSDGSGSSQDGSNSDDEEAELAALLNEAEENGDGSEMVVGLRSGNSRFNSSARTHFRDDAQASQNASNEGCASGSAPASKKQRS